MVSLAERFATVVVQPTTLCNLDCRYCYLLTRKSNNRMLVEVAQRVAEAIKEQDHDYAIKVLWHGGEPLAAGVAHFGALLEPFRELFETGKITHVVQTNATLINDKWCALFKEHEFHVGVSIDGPGWMPCERVDFRGVSVHPQILRGIERLKDAGIPFSTIAVVNNTNIQYPRELYQFFCDIGSRSAAFNIEEMEGANLNNDKVAGDAVMHFWTELLAAWKANPQMQLREANRTFSYIKGILNGDWVVGPVNPFPTVAWNGDVVLIAPELAGVPSERYHDFVAGNVLQTPLLEIVRSGTDNEYVRDFLMGVSRCEATCRYYKFCTGGHASNKFQEHGTTDATETEHCRNTRQRLLDAVLQMGED